ncbi:ribonuclease P protein subunit [Candidatus Woesearchaeota archaeon]|nr:ribonuclease P protein subunit [Candidatus Woesearchaeota archaeon]
MGEMLRVTESQNPSLVGIEGKVIDETRHTIEIETKKGIKTIIKDQVTVNINGKIIEGKKLEGRIEERIKNSQ